MAKIFEDQFPAVRDVKKGSKLVIAGLISGDDRVKRTELVGDMKENEEVTVKVSKFEEAIRTTANYTKKKGETAYLSMALKEKAQKTPLTALEDIAAGTPLTVTIETA